MGKKLLRFQKKFNSIMWYSFHYDRKKIENNEYRKVASSRLSRLVAHFRIFRLLVKGKFDAYVLWTLAKRVQNWIVDRSIACDFKVCTKKGMFWVGDLRPAQPKSYEKTSTQPNPTRIWILRANPPQLNPFFDPEVQPQKLVWVWLH